MERGILVGMGEDDSNPFSSTHQGGRGVKWLIM